MRISDWSSDVCSSDLTLLHRQHMRSGKVTLRDFNFERPTDRMEVSVDSLERIGDNAKYEVYDYPGLYAQRNDGEEAARRIMDIERSEKRRGGKEWCRTCRTRGLPNH